MLTKVWFRDVAERSIATFAEAALGVWILAGPGNLFNVSVLEGVGAAGLIAALAVIKGAIATQVGESHTASVDPEPIVTTLPKGV